MKPSRLVLWIGAALLLLPVLVGLMYSLLASVDMAGVAHNAQGWERAQRVLSDNSVWRGTVWSLWVAFASTGLAMTMAVGIAVAFRQSTRVDQAALAIASVPLAVPHLAAAITWLLILSQSGTLSRILAALGAIDGVAHMPALVSDPWGIGAIVTLAWKECAFLVLIASAVLSNIGVAQEESARTLGARPSQTFTRVTWPLLWRGMAPAVIAVATFAFGTYETLVLLAPSDPLALPLLTAERYVDPSLARRNDAFVLVVVAFAITALAVLIHERLREPREARVLSPNQ